MAVLSEELGVYHTCTCSVKSMHVKLLSLNNEVNMIEAQSVCLL